MRAVGGPLAYASYTYYPTVSGLLDSAPTLDVCLAEAAAIFSDPVGLVRHTAAAMPLLPAAPGLYATAVAHYCAGWPWPGRPA